MTSEVEFLMEVILFMTDYHTRFCKCVGCKVKKLTEERSGSEIIMPYSMMRAATNYRWRKYEQGRTNIRKRRTKR